MDQKVMRDRKWCIRELEVTQKLMPQIASQLQAEDLVNRKQQSSQIYDRTGKDCIIQQSQAPISTIRQDYCGKSGWIHPNSRVLQSERGSPTIQDKRQVARNR